MTLPALHIVHEHLRCVPFQAMAEIAELLEITPAEVHDTMSFYGFFPQAPIGDVRVWICRSLSCMLRGGDELLEHACQRLGIEPGETTADGKLTVEFAECLGICDFAPAALADDGRVFGPLDEESVDAMIEELKQGRLRAASRVGVEPAVRVTIAASGCRIGCVTRLRTDRPPEEFKTVAAFEPVLSRNWNVPDSHTLKVYESRGATRRRGRRWRRWTPTRSSTLVKDSELRGRGGAGSRAG